MPILSNRSLLYKKRLFHIIWSTYKSMSVIKRCVYVSGCPSSVSGPSGSIRSPNYPRNYNNYHRCSWGITVPSGYRIELTFQSFNTEQGFDKLDIYDGDSTSSPVLANQLQGRKSTPLVYQSTGSSMWFHFYSDFSETRTGFYATFRAGT